MTVPSPTGRPPVIDESVRQLIRDLRARGWSWTRIGIYLDSTGVPTAHGGRRWWPTTVRKAAQGNGGAPPMSGART